VKSYLGRERPCHTGAFCLRAPKLKTYNKPVGKCGKEGTPGAKMSIKDIHFFFPPSMPEYRIPNMGMTQLCAWLRKHRFSAGQTDLNIILQSQARESGVAAPFFGPATSYDGKLWNPDGPYYPLRRTLETAKHPPKVYEELYKKHVRPALRNCRCAGFSISSGEQITQALYFSIAAKRDYPKIKTVFGGPWAGASWTALEHWPEFFACADYVIGGPGELPLAALLRALRKKTPLSKVPSLARLVDGRVEKTPFAPPPPIEKIPPPVFDGLDLKLYPKLVLPYQTMSGCGWGRCRFCGALEQAGAYKIKSVEKAARELAMLTARYKPECFTFADLDSSVRMMDALSVRLIEDGVKLKWFTMIRATRELTPEVAHRLAKAGCIQLYIGLETASPSGLKKLDKCLDLSVLDANIDACAAADIKISLSVLNYPGQTEKEFKDTLDFVLNRKSKVQTAGIKRFDLPRTVAATDKWYGKDVPEQNLDLNSFNLPFIYGSGISEQKFRTLRERTAHALRGENNPSGQRMGTQK